MRDPDVYLMAVGQSNQNMIDLFKEHTLDLSTLRLLGIKRIAPHRVVFIEDNVEFFRAAELAQFIIVVGIGPGFVSVFQSPLVGLTEIGENFSLRCYVGRDISYRRRRKIAPQSYASRQQECDN
jgi:hypothetical protein